MGRQRRSAKAPPVEQPSPLHRIARVVADWKIVVTGIVLLGGGIAFAMSYKFATKAEMTAVQLDVQAHNAELAAIHQALEDIRWDVQQLLPKK